MTTSRKEKETTQIVFTGKSREDLSFTLRQGDLDSSLPMPENRTILL
jgi:hypothetical protein